MAHPLIEERGITSELAKAILRQLKESVQSQGRHHKGPPAFGIKSNVPPPQSTVVTSTQWDADLSFCFVQHYQKRLSQTSKTTNEISEQDWAIIRTDVGEKFPGFVHYTDKELIHHIKRIHNYARVMKQVLRLPDTDFDESFKGNYVFKKFTPGWESLLTSSKSRSQQRYIREFSRRTDNRDVYEVVEYQITQKVKSFTEKLTIKSGLSSGTKRSLESMTRMRAGSRVNGKTI